MKIIPDTTGAMIAGYAVFTIIMISYIVSLFLRTLWMKKRLFFFDKMER